MHFNKTDQILVANFVMELSQTVGEKFNYDIDFIILYGSAARGEFVKGQSDIDLLIQAKNGEKIEEIKQFANKIFWQLDEKYNLGLQEVCAKTPVNFLEKVFKKLESQTPLFAPLFVFGPDDLDWTNGRITKKDIALKANLFASQYSIFLNFKRDGKVYWGRDITREIKIKGSKWEKFKGILIPQYLDLGAAALILWLFLPRKALKYAIKAALYEIDGALIYLDKIAKYSLSEKIEELEKIFPTKKLIDFLQEYLRLGIHLKYKRLQRNIFCVIEESLKYKIQGFNGGRFEILYYIFKVLRFVLITNVIVVLKSI